MIDIRKYKAILTDLDGTLADTREVNYLAYEYAVGQFGYHLDYDYFKKYCNGRHYLDFLPPLTCQDPYILEKIHQQKKAAYSHYLEAACVNRELIHFLETVRQLRDKDGNRICKIGLVTTASKQNTTEFIKHYGLAMLFDCVVTHEDVQKNKPDPEGYQKAIHLLGVLPSETLIFEDSDVGIEAARKSGADYMEVKFEKD